MIKKILLFVLFVIIVGVGFLYYQLKSDIKANASTILFVIDDNKLSEEHKILHLILFRYFPNTSKINILFINDKLTILQKKIKSRTLNENYYLQEKDRIEFIKNELKKVFSNDMIIDNYINIDIDDFKDFINLFYNESFGLRDFQNDLFYNKDYLVRIISNIKFIKSVINKTNMFLFFKIIKFLKNNKDIIKTDIFSININSLKFYYALKNIKDFRFIDIPVAFKRNRIEINENFINKTEKLFLDENIDFENKNNVRLKVLNACKKQRMALKATDRLRNNDFDVFEWGSYNTYYDYSVIIDLTCNLSVSNELVNVLKCGEVLHRFDNKPFEDITIILGEDCNIYDKIDVI